MRPLLAGQFLIPRLRGSRLLAATAASMMRRMRSIRSGIQTALATLAAAAACSIAAGEPAPAPPQAIPPHASKALLAEEDALWHEEYERSKAQGLPASMLPTMTVPPFQGLVVRVEGREVILRITANPEARPLRTCYSFAIYDDRTYKGEAKVQEVLPDFDVRCELEFEKATVQVGDQASTKTL